MRVMSDTAAGVLLSRASAWLKSMIACGSRTATGGEADVYPACPNAGPAANRITRKAPRRSDDLSQTRIAHLCVKTAAAVNDLLFQGVKGSEQNACDYLLPPPSLQSTLVISAGAPSGANMEFRITNRIIASPFYSLSLERSRRIALQKR